MNEVRKPEQRELQWRFQRLSELTNREREALARDIDRVSGKEIRSRLERRFLLNNEQSLMIWMDSILAAWLNSVSFDPGKGSLRSWLWGFARHLALKYLAMLRRERATVTQPDELDKLPEPSARRADVMGACTLEETLSSLSDADSNLLRAHYLDGWSLRELARATGKSRQALKSRIHRIRMKLRRKWPRGPEDSKPGE